MRSPLLLRACRGVVVAAVVLLLVVRVLPLPDVGSIPRARAADDISDVTFGPNPVMAGGTLSVDATVANVSDPDHLLVFVWVAADPSCENIVSSALATFDPSSSRHHMEVPAPVTAGTASLQVFAQEPGGMRMRSECLLFEVQALPTPTATATLIPTATDIPTATATATMIPTVTATLPPTATATATEGPTATAPATATTVPTATPTRYSPDQSGVITDVTLTPDPIVARHPFTVTGVVSGLNIEDVQYVRFDFYRGTGCDAPPFAGTLGSLAPIVDLTQPPPARGLASLFVPGGGLASGSYSLTIEAETYGGGFTPTSSCVAFTIVPGAPTGGLGGTAPTATPAAPTSSAASTNPTSPTSPMAPATSTARVAGPVSGGGSGGSAADGTSGVGEVATGVGSGNGATTLPNTGAGTPPRSGGTAIVWLTVIALVIAGVALRARRRVSA